MEDGGEVEKAKERSADAGEGGIVAEWMRVGKRGGRGVMYERGLE